MRVCASKRLMEEGALVWARDQNGDYFKARIKHVLLCGDDALEYEVHYIGWNGMWDESVPDDAVKPFTSKRPPPEAPPELEWASEVGCLDKDDTQFEVDTLVRKRARQDGGGDEYLVHWKGWATKFDSWEPAANISDGLIGAFVPSTRAHRGDWQGPFSLLVPDPLPPDQVAMLVAPWLLTVGRKAAGLLARQQEAWAHKLLEKMDTCPAWVFKAIHASLKQMATTLNSGAPLHSPPPPPPATHPDHHRMPRTQRTST